MEKLKHYIIYEEDDYYLDENKNSKKPDFTICLEHPSVAYRTLCGASIDSTSEEKPEETDKLINCKYCLRAIKAIKELPDV